MDHLTEVSQLQKELQELKDQRTIGLKFRDDIMAVLGVAGHGVWQWSKENNLLLFDNNEAFWVDDLGYSSGEYTDEVGWWFQNLHPKSQQELAEAIDRYLSGEKKFFELEYRLKKKSGDWIWFWTRGIWTGFDKNGDPTGILGIYSNTTEKKEAEIQLSRMNAELEKRVAERTRQLTNVNQDLQEEIHRREKTEEELQWAKQQAEAANLAKTQFLANISHELRTPLHHILNYSKFGFERHDRPRERLTYYFNQINKSCKRLQILVDDLLDVSSLELGKVEYRFQSADIHLLVSDAAAEMNSMCQEKNISLDIGESPVSTILTCDRRRIEQVVYNLLSNALRYSTEDSSITVSFEGGKLVRDKLSKPGLKVSIADQGVGIPCTELDSIFDPFVQSSRTITGAGGTGLGLSICKKIVDGHHGKIWAANNQEGGAILSFLLPYEQKQIKSA